jgi:hypothetical protein
MQQLVEHDFNPLCWLHNIPQLSHYVFDLMHSILVNLGLFTQNLNRPCVRPRPKDYNENMYTLNFVVLHLW